MNQELKNKWLSSLRDSENKQGHYYLRSENNRFSCLGLLANLIDPLGWIKKQNFYFFDSFVCRLSVPILEKVGMSLDDQSLLCLMNDRGFTFHEIADYVERNF